MICTCPTTRAYPRPSAAHVPRVRPPAERLRCVPGAPPLARLSLAEALSHHRAPARGNPTCKVMPPFRRTRQHSLLTAPPSAGQPSVVGTNKVGGNPTCKVQVLTCAGPLASRAYRPHEPSVQSALSRSSVRARTRSVSLRGRASSRGRANLCVSGPLMRPGLHGPGSCFTPPVPGRAHSSWITRRLNGPGRPNLPRHSG